MTTNTTIAISWLVMLLVATTTGMAMQPYIIEKGMQDVDAAIHIVEYTEITDITTADILQLNSFDTWSVEDKKLLTSMMVVTVNPSYSDESFTDIIKDAPDHVLETFIDLLENAGY